MAFIAKNPIVAPETNSPLVPPQNTRGIFPKDDGWYEIDDKGNVSKLVADEDGKGLSSNDYTDEEKAKLEGLQDGEFYAFNFNYLTEKNESLSGEVTNVVGRVADLERTTQESINQLWGNANTKEDLANKVTTLNSNSTDTQYPSAKATYDELVKKANTTDLGLQFVNLGYFSKTEDFDKLNIANNCYGCFEIRSDKWLNARLNASVSGDFKQGYNGNVLVDTLAPNITVYFIVRQGNTITKGEGSSETTSTQIFYSGDIYLRRITEKRGRSIEFEW